MRERAPQSEPPPPPSGPRSGVVAPSLFRTDAGPGYWIRDDEEGIRLDFTDLQLDPCRVVRLSPTAAWFVPEAEHEYPVDTSAQVSLRGTDGDIGPLWGRIIAPPVAAEGALLGIAFNDMPYGPARSILLLLREMAAWGRAQLAHRAPRSREVVDAPARIRAIVKALAGVGNQGKVRGWECDAAPRILAITEEDQIHWSAGGEWGEAPFVIDLIGYNSIYRMFVPEMRLAGDRVETPLPTCIERVRHRQYRRGEARTRLTVSFRHPLWPRLPLISREVRDLSFGGVSFATTLDTDMLFPGLSLPFLEIQGEDGDFVRLRGEVRALTSVGGEEIAGISVQPYQQRDEARWNRIVADALYPTTDCDAKWSEPVWDLFKSSGYFNLSGKQPGSFDALQKSFFEVEDKGAKVPEIFCHAVFPSERGVEATMSLAKTYESTWWGHQLAKRAGAPPGGLYDARRVLRDIYLRGMEHPQTDPTFCWMIGLIEASVAWMRQSHIAFAEKHQANGDALVLPFHLYEASVIDVVSHKADLTMGPATPRDLQRLVTVVQATRAQAYVEALDFVSDRVTLARLSRKWRQLGLARERAVLIARREGRAIAAAVLETGETGTSLFHLFDNVRLFALAPGGEEAFVPLLDAARGWYADRGKVSFVYLCEHRDLAHAAEARLKDLGDGFLWIIAARLVPDFLEHVFELTQAKRGG